MSDSVVSHLEDSLESAKRAVEVAEDGSRSESVAENVVAWSERSLEIPRKEQ